MNKNNKLNNDLTHIAVVLDRSGSMECIKQDTIGGFNAFIGEQQKLKGDARITLAQFDSDYDIIYDDVDIKTVKKLTDSTFIPRGSTALCDAIGRTISTTAASVEKNGANKVICVILTDGGENSSKEFNSKKVKALIERYEEEYKWEFVFIGANQDAIVTGASFGIGMDKSITFAANGEATVAAFTSLSSNISSYRSGKEQSYSFKNEDRVIQSNLGA